MSEHDEQCLLFDWARINESKYPQLKMLFAIPNGGLRNKLVAKKLKREGVKAGVPDTFLAVPGYHFPDVLHGLFIEMKFGKNRPTKNQKEFLEDLGVEDYKTAVCYSFEEAKRVIIDYLGIKE